MHRGASFPCLKLSRHSRKLWRELTLLFQVLDLRLEFYRSALHRNLTMSSFADLEYHA